MKKEELEVLIEQEKSIYKIAKRINKVPNTVNYWIKKFNLESFYKNISNYGKSLIDLKEYNKEYFEAIVKDSMCLSECLDKLKIEKKGRNFSNLNRILKKFDINTNHFDGNKIRIEKLSLNRKELPLDFVLVENSSYSRTCLKNKLYKFNLKQRICEMCGQGEEWNGRKMSLILDHINGTYNDNRLENLRIICPNCNATLDTHCGRNNKK